MISFTAGVVDKDRRITYNEKKTKKKSISIPSFRLQKFGSATRKQPKKVVDGVGK